jgi:hypothetical protein
VTGVEHANDAWSPLIGVQFVCEVYGPFAAIQAFANHLNGLVGRIPGTTEESSYLSTRDFREIHDVKTPNFKKRINAGEVINNPCDNFKVKQWCFYKHHPALPTPIPSVVNNQNTATFLDGQISMPNVPMPVPPSDTAVGLEWSQQRSVSHQDTRPVLDIAINKAYGNINSGSFSYLEEIGESKETVAYFASVFERIASMVKAVKRGKWKEIVPKTYNKAKRQARRAAKRNGTTFAYEYSKATADFLSDAWLELRFAIRPLIYSAEDAIKLYNEGLDAKHGRIVSNHGEKDRFIDSNVSISEVDGIKTIRKYQVSSDRLAIGGVLLDVDTSPATLRELGFTNLAGAAWELLFLSWAADYFVDLSGLLYHLTPNVGVTPLTAWGSTRDFIKVTTEIRRYQVSDNLPIDTVKYITHIERYNRVPVTTPGFINIDVNLDIHKIADLAALYNALRRDSAKLGVIK